MTFSGRCVEASSSWGGISKLHSHSLQFLVISSQLGIEDDMFKTLTDRVNKS